MNVETTCGDVIRSVCITAMFIMPVTVGVLLNRHQCTWKEHPKVVSGKMADYTVEAQFSMKKIPTMQKR